MDAINAAIERDDAEALIVALQNPAVGLADIDPTNGTYYMDGLKALKAEKGAVSEYREKTTYLTRETHDDSRLPAIPYL